MATPPYLHDNNNSYDYYYGCPCTGDDFSSGYLEDALVEPGDRSKRRRLSFSSPDDAPSPVIAQITPLLCSQGCLNSGITWDMSTTRFGGFSDKSSWIWHSMSKETISVATAVPTSSEDAISSLSSLDCSTTITPAAAGTKRKQRVIKGVAYPFALIKPGGSEGDVTLDDINARILTTPTRPMRHPVGDFACRSYGGGRGPSGKAVVGVTRLHTQGGRGSITIIRTKG